MAELIGTLILIVGGPGTAIFAGRFVGGTLGVAMAFGLSLLCAAYLFGRSRGVTSTPPSRSASGRWARPSPTIVPFYLGAQIIGGHHRRVHHLGDHQERRRPRS